MSSTPGGPGSLARLRRVNRRTILTQLAGDGSLSRADLARVTGLSRTTVSSLVLDLIASGHVVETTERGTPHKGGSGRPPRLVGLAVPHGAVAGVDVGHGHVRVAVANGAGTLLAEEVVLLDADTSGARVLDLVARMVGEVAGSVALAAPLVAAVGMCVPAPIDLRTASVSTGILPGWLGMLPADELGRRLDVPIVVDNDANLGALGEVRQGAARGLHDVVYVKVASGLGAGIVLGGRVHRGVSGMAGELGHVQLGEDGEVCRCGNRGCLETVVAAPRLTRLLQPTHEEELTIPRIMELAATGDIGVNRVLNDAGRTIGRALADLCNSLNPAALVIGGSLGSAPAIISGIRTAVDRYAQPPIAAAVRVLPGQLGDRAEVVGAIALAIARVTAAD